MLCEVIIISPMEFQDCLGSWNDEEAFLYSNKPGDVYFYTMRGNALIMQPFTEELKVELKETFQKNLQNWLEDGLKWKLQVLTTWKWLSSNIVSLQLLENFRASSLDHTLRSPSAAQTSHPQNGSIRTRSTTTAAAHLLNV